MAALQLTKTAVSNISKSNIASLSQKASRICFTSASKHSLGKHAGEETNNGYDGDEAISYSGNTRSSDARNKMEEGKDRMKEGAGEMKDIPMDGMKAANEKIKERASEMKDKANEVARKAGDRASDMKGTASMAAGKVEEGRSKVAEKTKQTVASAWDSAKETSRNIKESIVGTNDDDDNDDNDRRGKPEMKDEGQII